MDRPRLVAPLACPLLGLSLLAASCAGATGASPGASGSPPGASDPGATAPPGVESPPNPSAPGSRCTIDAKTGDLSCAYQTLTIDARAVCYQTPLGTPPTAGWPVAIFFQGSAYAPQKMWSAPKVDLSPFGLFGTYNGTMIIKVLLDHGFAVVTPSADLNAFAWDTNLPPWNLDWLPAPDNTFMLDLFVAINHGDFGALSQSRWYATGVSSGGYMTSRMAVSYQGRFRALAILAGSYATCGGPACLVPPLPNGHPPTLFLHGGADVAVPPSTMYPYRDALQALSVPTRAVVDPLFGHGVIAAAPDEVLHWFQAY